MRSAECGVWSVDGPRRETSLRSTSAFRTRSGLTLIELLITILIISILAALILGVAAVAGETAREAHTRHVVARLHNLLMAHYESYQSRRVRLRPQVEAGIDSSNLRPAQKGMAKAQARLYALREMMLLEIPDRWSDILLTAVPSSSAYSVAWKYPVYLDVSRSSTNINGRPAGRTAISSIYLRRYLQVAQNAVSPAEVETLIDNQGAECLYLVITVACGDGEARALFGESSIGDTDGDGALEFLDGWGRPINFLRWAPGFDSLIQNNANLLGEPPEKSTDNPEWTTAASIDHDPFDLFRVDLAAFRLVPLIYSAGRDETFGIRLVKPYVAWEGITNLGAAFNPNSAPQLSPYGKVIDPDVGGQPEYLGTVNADGTATDNVNNHLIGQR